MNKKVRRCMRATYVHASAAGEKVRKILTHIRRFCDVACFDEDRCLLILRLYQHEWHIFCVPIPKKCDPYHALRLDELINPGQQKVRLRGLIQCDT